MRRGGIVFKAHGELRFLPALAVQQVLPLPPIARIPSAPPELAGVAQAEGEIVPVIDLRDGKDVNGSLIVCSYLGEPLGVAVREIVSIGHYDVDPEQSDAVVVAQARARPLDLASLYAKLQAAATFRP
jgi:purine-binding chemotaxis protein CheW